ncbi:MAG: hypothetical protein Q8Q18_00315 [bacterium]|nr:hypothetical protein [bacterium]
MNDVAVLLDMFGTLLIAYAALTVHHRVLHEHRIDEKVFRSMKSEQRLGILGVALVIFSAVISILN